MECIGKIMILYNNIFVYIMYPGYIQDVSIVFLKCIHIIEPNLQPNLERELSMRPRYQTESREEVWHLWRNSTRNSLRSARRLAQ